MEARSWVCFAITFLFCGLGDDRRRACVGSRWRIRIGCQRRSFRIQDRMNGGGTRGLDFIRH